MPYPAAAATERRALWLLVVVTAVSLTLGVLAVVGLIPSNSPAFALRRLLGAATNAAAIAGVAGVMVARASGLATTALVLLVAATLGFTLQGQFSEALALGEDARGLFIGLLTTLRYAGWAFLAWDLARAFGGPASDRRGVHRWGPWAMAALASLCIIARAVDQILGAREAFDGTREVVIVCLSNLSMAALVLWRMRSLRDASAASAAPPGPEAVSPASPLADAWHTTLGGARLIKQAAIGSVILAVTMFVLAFAVSAARASSLAVLLAVVAAGAGLTLVIMNLIGLGRLRRVPLTSGAKGAFTSAWVFALMTIIGAGLFVLLVLASLARGQSELARAARHVPWLQVDVLVVGAATAIALYAGVHRLGHVLGEARLRARARATLYVTIAGQGVAFVLGNSDFREGLGLAPATLFTQLGALAIAIVTTVCVVMTLTELERAVARRHTLSKADAWQ